MKEPNLSEIALNDFRALWRDIGGEVLRATERVGESGWYILGGEVAAFEKSFAQTCRAKAAVGCANGLDAIELGLRAAGIRPGDRVLTTPLSAFATTLAIVRAGGVPVFVDVDGSGLMNLDLASQLLQTRPDIRFLVPVHLYGHALDLARLAEIRDRFGVLVIEDCAQAVGAASGGQPVGSVGSLAATSFYPTKNLGCLGDGGAVFTNDDALAEKVRMLRDYGQSTKYNHAALGLNSRLDELQAAILLTALLPRLAKFTARRQAIAARYLAKLRHPCLVIPPAPALSASVWHLFPVIVEGDRERFRQHLSGQRVGSAVHYPGLIPEQPAMKAAPCETAGSLAVAGRFAQREVSLPIHPYLSEDDVSRVIEACNRWEN